MQVPFAGRQIAHSLELALDFKKLLHHLATVFERSVINLHFLGQVMGTAPATQITRTATSLTIVASAALWLNSLFLAFFETESVDAL